MPTIQLLNVRDVGNPNLERPESNLVSEYLVVKQNEFQISEKELVTWGLGSCTGLGFSISGKNFLVHIDATTKVSKIVEAIRKNFKESELLKTIFYYRPGPANSFISEDIAVDIMDRLNIPNENRNIQNVDSSGIMTIK
jgi:hypothetical protein